MRRDSGCPLFLTEVKASESKNTLDQFEDMVMPELEIVQTEMSADKQGLLESHFAYVGGENTATKTKTIQQKDNNNSSKESTLNNVGQNIPKAVYFRDVFQASIDEQTKGEKNYDDDAAR